MGHCLYVIKPFRYERRNAGCGCHKTIRFGIGQRLYVLNDPFYIESHGWNVSVQREGEEPFNMSARFIDELYQKRMLMTWLDVELQMNYQAYKIDQALHVQDEGLFQMYTKAYKQMKHLYTHEAVSEGSKS
ncbi:hypothetical protein [Halobacillus aidingensis]|uniref:Uncharacterized protein n=1 Tax=Halobacillus aidingensis TaxID=240303 RepID=A0A1H0ICI1_HALAD|nr:hypothetical protein [Halobacillus aidingensis]SDO29075.1 hypothetical protein SAMN05421677_10439 [Halobacillus aidingensis]